MTEPIMDALTALTLVVALFDLILFGASIWMGYQTAKGRGNEKDR